MIAIEELIKHVLGDRREWGCVCDEYPEHDGLCGKCELFNRTESRLRELLVELKKIMPLKGRDVGIAARRDKKLDEIKTLVKSGDTYDLTEVLQTIIDTCAMEEVGK